jgi:hypothetical protein
VNNETKVFNRKLLELMKPYKHVLIVKGDTDRKFYTRHGLHMNSGKEKIASKVSTTVKNIFQKQNVKISSFWKNGYDISVKRSGFGGLLVSMLVWYPTSQVLRGAPLETNGGTKTGLSTISLGRLQCVRRVSAGPTE